mmetsp:Transcript_57713/g.115619  ORF Transcript_57713/g.115619 Transcript_57713/m.115619 type:complete len:283 (+) Transcript_57713:127-975(+)
MSMLGPLLLRFKSASDKLCVSAFPMSFQALKGIPREHCEHRLEPVGSTANLRCFRLSNALRRFDSKSTTMPLRAWTCLSSAISLSRMAMRSSRSSLSIWCKRARTCNSLRRCACKLSVKCANCLALVAISCRLLSSCATRSATTSILSCSILSTNGGNCLDVCTSCCSAAWCAACSVSKNFSKASCFLMGCHNSQIHKKYSAVSWGRCLWRMRQANDRRSFFMRLTLTESASMLPRCSLPSCNSSLTSLRKANSVAFRSCSCSLLKRSSFSFTRISMKPWKL